MSIVPWERKKWPRWNRPGFSHKHQLCLRYVRSTNMTLCRGRLAVWPGMNKCQFQLACRQETWQPRSEVMHCGWHSQQNWSWQLCAATELTCNWSLLANLKLCLVCAVQIKVTHGWRKLLITCSLFIAWDFLCGNYWINKLQMYSKHWYIAGHALISIKAHWLNNHSIFALTKENIFCFNECAKYLSLHMICCNAISYSRL